MICAATMSFAQVKMWVDASEKLWDHPRDEVVGNLHHLWEQRWAMIDNTFEEVITYMNNPHESTELYFRHDQLVMINHFFYDKDDTLDKFAEIAKQELGEPTGQFTNTWLTPKSIVSLKEARGSYVCLNIKEKDIE